MKKLLLTFCSVAMPGIILFSQDIPVKPVHKLNSFIYLETGFIDPGGTINESIAIRQNLSSYFVNQSTNGEISTETSGFIYGLRWEFFNANYRTGLSTGLRYTRYACEISGYSSSNADFFYLRYSMLNSDTKFARVKSMNETSNYISIPLEIIFIPIQMKGLGFFAKVGSEVSILKLKKSTNIHFQDKSMESQEDAILTNIGVTGNKTYSTIYGSLGCKLGKENKPNFIFEVFLPSIFLTKNNFTLVDTDQFSGIKLSVQFPVN